MTKENLSKLFSFKTLYLALLTFVILHLILLPFGLSFTPVLWNSWFFILCLTFFIHPWIVFFGQEIFIGITLFFNYPVDWWRFIFGFRHSLLCQSSRIQPFP